MSRGLTLPTPTQVLDASKTLGVLGLLTAALPVNLAVTSGALARTALLGTPARPARPAAGRRRTVLVSGGKMTKALQLCRSFHAAGHRVVLVESGKYRLTGHRFSRSVDRFLVVPDPLADDYAQALLDIVEREGVDVYVPVCSPAASIGDARAKALLSEHCEVLHLDPDMVELLDDKGEFTRLAGSLGLAVPDTHRVTDAEEVLALLDADSDVARSHRPYVLKSIAYDPVHRLDLTRLPFGPADAMEAFVRSLPISPDNPWILQEFIEGQEYCTHGTVRDGRLTVHLCCESSAFQINYAMVDQPQIREWVEILVGALGLTGQVSLDFIVADDDHVSYAIECNPRTHSAITMLRGDDRVAGAYLDDLPGAADGEALAPAPGTPATYWLYHEVFRLLAHPLTAPATVRTILGGTDAIFDPDDPLPFLMVHHLQLPWLLLQSLRRGGSWIRVDFNIGKLVEPAGD